MRHFPFHGWAGLALVALCWPLNWTLPGLRTHLLFFPLWLGYVLTVDALVLVRTGTSILHRSRRDFVSLFAASVPAWWLFEALNERLGNWIYRGGEELSDLQYGILASLAFSTVIPAVFESAELVRSVRWLVPGKGRLARGPRIPDVSAVHAGSFLLGAAMLVLLLVRPRIFYPLAWLSLIFLLEPVCRLLGRRSLLAHLSIGDWRPVVSLALGALVCGFFWELWNVHAWPKWVYDTPGFEFWHLFEMPFFGYFGYPPFGLELYVIAHLVIPWRPAVRL